MKLYFNIFVHSRSKIPQNKKKKNGGVGRRQVPRITKETWQSISGTATPADRRRDCSKIPSTPAYAEPPVIGVKNIS